MAALRPKAALPALDHETVLVDGWPVSPDDATVNVLAKLGHPSRTVGASQPLVDGPAGKAIADWYEDLPAEFGRWYYVAIPHAESSPDLRE
jgi:hypothetical protein